MTRPTTDKLQLELKENLEKVQQLNNMINSLKIRNIQIEAVIADRSSEQLEKKQKLKEDQKTLYGEIN
tara:strand:- start:172 stop:375 length:204 start_codon:yes stop_codon:yes gene_type:complete